MSDIYIEYTRKTTGEVASIVGPRVNGKFRIGYEDADPDDRGAIDAAVRAYNAVPYRVHTARVVTVGGIQAAPAPEPTLPTEPGFYIPADHADNANWTIYALVDGRGWYGLGYASGSYPIDNPERYLRHRDLVRLDKPAN